MTDRELLRRAVENEPVPRDLQARVRTSLEQKKRRWMFVPLSGLAVACLALLFTTAQAYTVAMLRTGLADHVQCGLGHQFPVQDSEAEMASSVGPEFAPLIQPISRRNGGLRLVSAHRCSVKDREYVHFVFRSPDDTLTSVSLTKKRSFEWIPGQQRRRIDGISVLGFEEDDYMVYISSREPQEELARNLPQILTYRL